MAVDAGFREYLATVRPRLVKRLAHRWGKEWAEDGAQHALASALEAGEKFREEPSPFDWLLKEGRNYLRRRARWRSRFENRLSHDVIDPAASPPGVADASPHSVLIPAVLKALNELLEEDRTRLTLYYFGEKTDRQTEAIISGEGNNGRGWRRRRDATLRLGRILLSDPETLRDARDAGWVDPPPDPGENGRPPEKSRPGAALIG
jgi:DNA-directed RNA polymerase specialized sigma24 family protein